MSWGRFAVLIASVALIALAMRLEGSVRTSDRLAPAATLLNEGFEAGAVPPAGWSQQSSNAAYTWEITGAIAHSGNFAAELTRDPNPIAVQNEWLLSPPISATDAILSFWSMGDLFWCRDVLDNCELFVWLVVGDIGGADDIWVGRADDDWTGTGEWSLSTFDLTPSLPGGGASVRIGFNFLAWDDREGVALDDVLVMGESGPDPEIFADGFETGNTTLWSDSAP